MSEVESKVKPVKTKLVNTIFAWIFGIIFSIFGLLLMILNFLGGLILLLNGLFLIPSLNKILANKTKFNFTPIMSIVGSIALFILAIVVIGNNYKPVDIRDQPSQTQNNNPTPQSAQVASNPEPKKDATPAPQPTISKPTSLTVDEIKAKIKDMNGDQSIAFMETNDFKNANTESQKIVYDKINQITLADNIKNSEPLPEYKVLKRDSNELKGNYYKFKGKVEQIQITADGNKKYSTLRVSVNSKFDQIVYLIAEGKIDAFEGDTKNFVAVGDGDYTYTSQANYQITLPSLIIKQVK